MSNTAYIGRQMRSFDSTPEFDGFSKVVIQVSDEVEYTAGNDAGRTLTLANPWGTQTMANRILAKIKGFQYQPYTAEGARLDPAAELGDAVTANNTHGGIYTRRETFGPLMSSTVSAPEDEEINHEYQYVSKQDRVIRRNMRELTAELRVQAGLIELEVANRKTAIQETYAAISVQADRITQEVKDRKTAINETYAAIDIQAGRITQEVTDRKADVATLSAALTLQAGLIEAKVSKTGGNNSYFGWALTDSDWTLKSNGSTILKATRYGLEITGKVTATSGKIGGFDILQNYLSYNGQTWGGTNTWGAYLGTSGLQLGQNFKVDMSGNLTAQSGRFNGTIYAQNISFGDDNGGYLNGGAISGGSIYGNRLVGGTITTDYTSSGINAALSNGNWAANLFSGVSDYNASIKIGTVSCTKLYKDGDGFSTKSVTIKDYYGKNVTIAYWGW